MSVSSYHLSPHFASYSRFSVTFPHEHIKQIRSLSSSRHSIYNQSGNTLEHSGLRTEMREFFKYLGDYLFSYLFIM